MFGGELTSRMERSRSLYQKDCRAQTAMCVRVKERGEDLLHEWDLEGPALAVGDGALPWQPSVRVGPAARALTACQPRRTKTGSSSTQRVSWWQLTQHHFGIADALPWDKTSSSSFQCLISSFPSLILSHTHSLRVSVMLFAGTISSFFLSFLRESLSVVSLSRWKMLTSFSLRENVLLVCVWRCRTWDLEERHGRGRSLSAP